MVIYNCPKGQGHKQIPKDKGQKTHRKRGKENDEHKHKERSRTWFRGND